MNLEQRAIRDLNGCLLWTGPIDKDGYGCVSVGGMHRRAHRLSYESARGAIPANLCVLHTCDVRSCIEPNHLFLGTRSENAADRHAKGRNATGEQHGSKTHPERFLHNGNNAPRGGSHHKAKLSESDVIEIRRRRAAGDLLKNLAADFGVSTLNISWIARRKTWKHVP